MATSPWIRANGLAIQRFCWAPQEISDGAILHSVRRLIRLEMAPQVRKP